MDKLYTNLKKIEEKDGEVEFEAEIPVEVLDEYLKAELAKAAAGFEWPGFRKGKVPENIVREHVHEMALVEDAADEVLHDVIPEIAADEKLSVLGRPKLTLTKIAPKNPLGFKLRFALSPAVILPDYKKIGHEIAKRKQNIEITAKEVDEAIDRIKTMIPVAGPSKEVAAPPEITDEFVQQFGPFKTVAEFREEIKRQLEQEKELEMKEARRDELVREIVKHSKVKVPQMLIEQEVDDWKDNRAAELEKLGLTLEKYLEQVKKSETELEKDARQQIEEQMRTSFVLREIRKAEDIKADDKEIRQNLALLKQRYPEQDEAELARPAEAIAIQKKMFDILEDGGPRTEDGMPGTHLKNS
ncbi:MAG: hypothetical protein KGJ13_01475 [Patescibacteria group bacterium]|nr:hypothetical protein [Patescibacteria group bacterium]